MCIYMCVCVCRTLLSVSTYETALVSFYPCISYDISNQEQTCLQVCLYIYIYIYIYIYKIRWSTERFVFF